MNPSILLLHDVKHIQERSLQGSAVSIMTNRHSVHFPHRMRSRMRRSWTRYDTMRIAMNNVRVLWSPASQISLRAWPDSLNEKSCAMKALDLCL